MLKYPCLVLDHDDTVVQTERTIGYPYFREYLRRIRPGIELSFSEYVHCCNNMIFADMCRRQWQFTDEELQEEYLGWKEYSRQNIPPVFPGIENIIKRQRELGGIICVSSLSTGEIIQRDYLHHFGFLPDKIYDYELAADLRKPNTYALTDIMEHYSLTPGQILVVDDMLPGQQMAAAAGVSAAFAGWSKADFPELTAQMEKCCQFCFHSTAEFEQFLFG